MRAWWSAGRDNLPAWVDLGTGEASPYPAPSGMVAASLPSQAEPDGPPPVLPAVESAPDYCSATLILLARIGWSESRGAE